MIARFLSFLTFCYLAGFASAQANRSESNLGQIVVHGGTPQMRAEIIQDAEALIRALDTMVNPSLGQTSPIVLELFPPITGQPGAIRRELLTIPEDKNRFRFQLNVRLSAPGVYPQKDLKRTLLEVFLIERGIRGAAPDELPESFLLAPWLIDGIGEAIAWQAKKGERAVYAALRDNGGWMTVGKLIDQKKTGLLDPLSHELFRASSGALTMALLAQPDGKKSMSHYLNEASGFAGEPIELLRKHFPDVNLGREGLEKWWLTQVAALAEPGLTQTMTIKQTEKEIVAALKLYLPDETGRLVPRDLEAWPDVMDLEKNEDRLAAIRQASDLLTGLSYRCFPTYRPVIGGYLKTLADLTGEKRDHIMQALDNLNMFREAERRRHERLVDLLDWYHLSTVQEDSGEFDDYLAVKKELEKAEVPADDPLINYVDQAQKLFEKRENSSKGVTKP
ncbi:hypothetical protein N8539_00385 [Akkermansiaceae bacterium]|nr:hypothetical protein [Akkermansiaceae bacterium]